MAPLRFIKWIDEGTPITLYGDGSAARDFTYVDDIARGTILAAQLWGGQLRSSSQESECGRGLHAPTRWASVVIPNAPLRRWIRSAD